ncbi:site-specific integrase [Flavobacterium amniphilum]|uniref:phage integrase SAM-like domain-containing protein n=1 Tax=Flavobacterium amniphilum TaxID=1834035 RepID=UPI00202A6FC4|nr:phage integrase SAM-like domain-containing protein [Flavobacterium amniphilum]MCL9806923.1 site-specific integrase [Flavobacterium amniphilum]
MATIKFSIRGNNNPTKIYIRFVANRETDIKLATPLVVNPTYFNPSNGKIRKISQFAERDSLQNQLDTLEYYIINKYNEGTTKGDIINKDWLTDCLNLHFNKFEKKDANFLLNYCDIYIEKLGLKTNDRTGELGTSKTTITKYKTIKLKIQGFQEYKRHKYKLSEVDLKYRNDFLKYLLEVEKLSRNTAGRYIKFLKTICLDAQKSGYTVSPQLQQIKGFSVQIDKTYLNWEELAKIEDVDLKEPHLQDARDWLLIGCYIGQRAGDLLQLTSQNIKQIGNLDFIELIQQKTKKRVSILIHNKVKDILNKRDGNFPPIYSQNIDSSKTKFNLYIKDVCKEAKLDEIISGARINPDTSRKENGDFPKWELVTSHICRRSFATNYYGDIPTGLLMNVTGHSTEKEFLNYIGKTAIDYAQQMAMYWNIQSQKQEKESVLRIAK